MLEVTEMISLAEISELLMNTGLYENIGVFSRIHRISLQMQDFSKII